MWGGLCFYTLWNESTCRWFFLPRYSTDWVGDILTFLETCTERSELLKPLISTLHWHFVSTFWRCISRQSFEGLFWCWSILAYRCLWHLPVSPAHRITMYPGVMFQNWSIYWCFNYSVIWVSTYIWYMYIYQRPLLGLGPGWNCFQLLIVTFGAT